MRIIFISNYFNHHQSQLCEALYQATKGQFRFLETRAMSEERKQIGYRLERIPPYVIRTSDMPRSDVLQFLRDAEVVICGSDPQNLAAECINSGVLLFRYSERPLRHGLELHKYVFRWMRWRKNNPKRSPIYLLCASAFTAMDYKIFGLFRNRAFQWGYFPVAKRYDSIENIIENKSKTKLLWCGRFLPLKHPDDALRTAKHLKTTGVPFHLDMIGAGPMEDILKKMTADWELEDCVSFLGSMKPEQVRGHMEQAGIYLFTSDRQEGWGAVLNEAMNSGCAVVASHAIGSVPFLLNNNENGLIYRSGDIDGLYTNVKRLLENPEEQRLLGRAAYNTIINEWNAEIAAERLLSVARYLLNGEDPLALYKTGPCSKAPVIADDWM